MRTALIAVVVFLSPHMVQAQRGHEPARSGQDTQSACVPPRDVAYRASQIAALMAHGMDLATTADALSRPGFHEANPALAWASDQPLALGATKMALAAGSLLIAHELHRSGHRHWAIVANIATTALITTVAIRNARQTR